MVEKMFGKEIEFKCKILPYGVYTSLIFGLNIAMVILFIGIYIGLPTIVNTVLLVGAMFLIFMFISNDATFTLSQSGLTKTLEEKNFLFKNKPQVAFLWNDIKSYKQGTDNGKYRGEIKYLEIKFNNGDVWKITDMYGERQEGFDAYVSFFLASVDKINLGISSNYSTQNRSQKSNQNISSGLFIERKKTFYETIYAKIFTLLLGILIAFILTFKSSLNITSWIKLSVVLIPGFAYMAHRTFIKKYP